MKAKVNISDLWSFHNNPENMRRGKHATESESQPTDDDPFSETKLLKRCTSNLKIKNREKGGAVVHKRRHILALAAVRFGEITKGWGWRVEVWKVTWSAMSSARPTYPSGSCILLFSARGFECGRRAFGFVWCGHRTTIHRVDNSPQRHSRLDALLPTDGEIWKLNLSNDFLLFQPFRCDDFSVLNVFCLDDVLISLWWNLCFRSVKLPN